MAHGTLTGTSPSVPAQHGSGARQRLTGVRTGDQPDDWRANTRGLAGDAPRTVTSETLVACGEHVETRRTSQKTTGGRDQTERLTRLTTSKTKLEEASTDGSAHSTLDRNVSQV